MSETETDGQSPEEESDDDDDEDATLITKTSKYVKQVSRSYVKVCGSQKSLGKECCVLRSRCMGGGSEIDFSYSLF